MARDGLCPAGRDIPATIMKENQSFLSGSSALFDQSACEESTQQFIQHKLPESRKLLNGEKLPDRFADRRIKGMKARCILKSGVDARRPSGPVLIYPFNYFW
jgi:hypothetical protein